MPALCRIYSVIILYYQILSEKAKKYCNLIISLIYRFFLHKTAFSCEYFKYFFAFCGGGLFAFS